MSADDRGSIDEELGDAEEVWQKSPNNPQKSPPHVKKSPNNAHEVFARAAYQQLIIKLRISSIKSMKTSQKS